MAQIDLGRRVKGKNPLLDEVNHLPEPDPATSREVRFAMTKASGKRSWFKLIWSLDEIQAVGAKIGATVDFDMPELGIIGPARCTYIGPCPEFKEGDGNLVIGVFKHEPDGPIVNVHIEGLEKPIGSTANHPFWSEDRQDYVAAGELQPGEQVWSELRGTVRVKSVTPAPDAPFVYNLTVHNQHVYEVSKLGVLVHNGCAKWGKQIKGVTQQHHLVSHYKNSARGFSWSTKGQDILKKAGINPKNSGWNKVHLPKHKVPHSELYHKRVFERLLVTNWNPDLFVAFLQEGPHLDFPCVIGNWHLMSALMREVLEQAAPDSIQFLPIRIRSPHGEVIDEPYFVANYLRLLDVVDREYSRVLDDEWSLDETGEFTNVEYAVLNRPMIGDASVFRVLGQPELVVYREDIVAQMRDRELTGCVFSPVPCSD